MARGRLGKLWILCLVVAILAVAREAGKQYGWDNDAALQMFRGLSDKLGIWVIPLYVMVHTLTFSLCLPYAAVFFEAGASLLFGFLPAIICVFSAKILAASLSFWIGRFLFRGSSTAREWAQGNKYFHILSRGVERDGWKFVLLARFSPIPSYVINYALAATKVGFFMDFLLPTVIGCLPMILQNTSIGSLASIAVASTTGSEKSQVLSYLFPLLGIVSSILISFRIKKYSSEVTVDAELKPAMPSSGENIHECKDNVDSSQVSVGKINELRKRQ